MSEQRLENSILIEPENTNLENDSGATRYILQILNKNLFENLLYFETMFPNDKESKSRIHFHKMMQLCRCDSKDTECIFEIESSSGTWGMKLSLALIVPNSNKLLALKDI